MWVSQGASRTSFPPFSVGGGWNRFYKLEKLMLVKSQEAWCLWCTDTSKWTRYFKMDYVSCRIASQTSLFMCKIHVLPCPRRVPAVYMLYLGIMAWCIYTGWRLGWEKIGVDALFCVMSVQVIATSTISCSAIVLVLIGGEGTWCFPCKELWRPTPPSPGRSQLSHTAS